MTVKVDSRDWRSHLEQMHAYRDGIEQALDSTKSQLDKLHTDVSRTLEKISSREKYLNSQLEAPLSDLRQLQDNLAATKEQYRQVFERILFNPIYPGGGLMISSVVVSKYNIFFYVGEWRCHRTFKYVSPNLR